MCDAGILCSSNRKYCEDMTLVNDAVRLRKYEMRDAVSIQIH